MNCRFSLSTFLLAVNLERAIFVQSSSYSRQNVTMCTAPKNESESENCAAAVSDPAVCVLLGDKSRYTSADPTKTHGEGLTVRGP